MRSATTRVVAAASTSALAFGLWAAALGGAAPAHRPDAGDRGSAQRAAVDFALKAARLRHPRHRRPGAGRLGRRPRSPAIGCATRTGVEHENHEADATSRRRHRVRRKTALWTSSAGGAVHSYSQNTTANVVLAQSGLGTLEITAISSLSHAWHDAQGFHSETSTSIGKLRFVPPVGAPQELDIPTPGQPIEIPGLARIALGGGPRPPTTTAASRSRTRCASRHPERHRRDRRPQPGPGSRRRQARHVPRLLGRRPRSAPPTTTSPAAATRCR